MVDKYKIEWDTAADYSNIGTSGYVHEFTDLSAGAGHGDSRTRLCSVRFRYLLNLGFGKNGDGMEAPDLLGEDWTMTSPIFEQHKRSIQKLGGVQEDLDHAVPGLRTMVHPTQDGAVQN